MPSRFYFPFRSRSVSRSEPFSLVNVNAVIDGVLFAVRDALRNISNNGPFFVFFFVPLRNILLCKACTTGDFAILVFGVVVWDFWNNRGHQM
jgi:hypothetical protein